VRTANFMPMLSVAILTACAGAGWRTQQIDGSTSATVERSVGALRNTLPSPRREQFDIALGVIFMRTAGYHAGDLDGDGDVNDRDARTLSDMATALWAEIERGNLVTAIEAQGSDVAATYFRVLDRLTYDDVLELAGDADGEYLALVRQQISAAGCAERRGRTLGRINDGCK
jgi:hypothetical protein